MSRLLFNPWIIRPQVYLQGVSVHCFGRAAPPTCTASCSCVTSCKCPEDWLQECPASASWACGWSKQQDLSPGADSLCSKKLGAFTLLSLHQVSLLFFFSGFQTVFWYSGSKVTSVFIGRWSQEFQNGLLMAFAKQILEAIKSSLPVFWGCTVLGDLEMKPYNSFLLLVYIL